jgi:hypothetical protein
MRHYEAENPLWDVVKAADLQCMEEISRREVTHNTGNMSKLIE